MKAADVSSLLSDLGFKLNGLVLRSEALKPEQAAFVVLFPYILPHEEQQPAELPSNHLHIASFAAANYYSAMVRLLKSAVYSLCQSTGAKRSDFRIGVNSGLQEKKLALDAGLGFIGRSSLLVNPLYGAACLIGVLLMPAALLDPDTSSAQPTLAAQLTLAAKPAPATVTTADGCRNCRACAEACPSAAIDGLAPPGSAYRRESCLQHWTASMELPPAIAACRGARLYGCDACILACPYTLRRNPQPARDAVMLLSAKECRPGRSMDQSFLLQRTVPELKVFFKGTCLGRSWLPPEAFQFWAAQWSQK